MKPHADDPIGRLAAADPARSLAVDKMARASLWQSIRASAPQEHATARPRRRLRSLALVGPVLLALAAAALAAGGVIRFGAPAERPGGHAPQLRGGGLVKGTVRLLGVASADPVGGPPWGMRVLSTKYGEGCVQVGRLLHGQLGAIGQDNAFADDGLFHEFPVRSAFVPHACTVLDGNGRIFLNATVGDLPASAWVGYGGGCVPGTATRAERFSEDGKPRALCPQADERNLYYGLLGPDAKSITYVLNGNRHTQATVGPEGAYLIVTKASPNQLFNFSAGRTQDIVPVDGPITELHYRNGSTCHLTARSWIGGREACTPELKVPVGWVAPKTAAPTAARATAPLHVKLITQGGNEIVVSFKAPIAITSARSNYTLKSHQPGMPPQVNGYEPTHGTIAAGQTVTMRIGQLGPALRSGVTTGTVILSDATGPGQLEEGPGTVERVVGRFSVRVP